MKALVLRRFSHGGIEHKSGSVIDVAEGFFADWSAVGLVGAVPEKDAKAEKPKENKTFS